MNVPIPFLSALVLICVAFPTQLFRIAMMAFDSSKSTTSAAAQLFGRLGLAAFSVVVAGLAWYAAPLPNLAILPDWPLWLVGAAVIGAAAPAWEIGLGYLIGRARRKRIGGVALHEHWPAGSLLVTVSAVVIAVAEEVIFRGVGLNLLTGPLGWSAIAAVALTSAVYGLNHLYFGWLTVAQKTLTGAVFGVLFLAGGGLLLPVVAHVMQNLVVLTVVPRLTSGKRQADR